MSNYNELKTQAEALMDQAEQLRSEARTGVIAEISTMMLEHGISINDLATSSRKPAASKAKSPAKYRGPNGELWSGGPGRKPGWAKIAIEAGELDKYLIA